MIILAGIVRYRKGIEVKALEKQYNIDVKNPANFNIDKQSYMAGGRAALRWALTCSQSINGSGDLEGLTISIIPSLDIKQELENE